MNRTTLFKSNINIYNLISRIANKSRNVEFDKIIRPVLKIDSIEDFECFSGHLRRLKIRYPNWPSIYCLGVESTYYGHLKALVEYAGLEYRDSYRLALPNIEHGVAWLQRVPNNVRQPYVHCAVAQGAYRKQAVCAERPGMPFYTVGPYIHYAAQYYPEGKLAELKRELGRTLLVFPAHTYELSDVSYGRERFVESVMGSRADGYDSVLVSAYWHDADDEVFSLFEKAGARVVSSGMREDPLFISRLKTLITLSDAVMGNALGTHIGYCHCLGKPFYMLGDEAARVSDAGNAFKTDEERQLDEVFEVAASLYRPGAAPASQAEFYRRYWGGPEAIRSREEVRCIIETSQEVLRRSHGWTGRFAHTVSSLLEESARGDTAQDRMRHRLLSEALGRD